MKHFFSALLVMAMCTATASAITVATPANGAQVTSPFTLVANTSTCGSVSAVSMGYSIDHGAAIIEPTSFTASVTAAQGAHVLHVKCWGKQTSGEVLLNITVVPAAPVVSDITVLSPANGAQVTSPFNLVASTTTCGSKPAVSMGYSIDGGNTTLEPPSFSAAVAANPGTHVLTVKCTGQNVTAQTALSVRVIPPPVAATPKFSLASGQFCTKQVVSMSDTTPGAAIYFTTDGSGPSTSSPAYAGPISIASSTVVQAMAVAPGYTKSGLALAQYVITTPKSAIIPPNATKQAAVHNMPNWRIKHDPATPGTSTGIMTMVSDPSMTGHAEKFDTTFTNGGGELYSLSYANDADAKNFVYDAQVWIDAGSTISNLEMDNNQVIPNGDTVIYAFQCSGYAGVWEYSANVGTRTSPIVKWLRSTVPCNPANWTPNQWHHVQISYSRDNAGNVTYHSVWLDGVQGDINQTVPSAFTLGWASGVLVTNFQVDGIGATGSSTLYLDDLAIYRW
jgi:hypothetical protein